MICSNKPNPCRSHFSSLMVDMQCAKLEISMFTLLKTHTLFCFTIVVKRLLQTPRYTPVDKWFFPIVIWVLFFCFFCMFCRSEYKHENIILSKNKTRAYELRYYRDGFYGLPFHNYANFPQTKYTHPFAIRPTNSPTTRLTPSGTIFKHIMLRRVIRK